MGLKMNTLLFGCNGLLGKNLLKTLTSNCNAVGVDEKDTANLPNLLRGRFTEGT